MHGKALDSASHKNKLLLWNVFVKWLPDGWGLVYPVAVGGAAVLSLPGGSTIGPGIITSSEMHNSPTCIFISSLYSISVAFLASQTKDLSFPL